jgi:hypothetical protein
LQKRRQRTQHEEILSMTVTELPVVRAELSHAISAIQSEWSARERERRQRLADLRQRRLIRMLSPQERAEAYDCQCDINAGFDGARPDDAGEIRRSHRYVLVEG